MPTWKLTVEYKGTRYRGWQAQKRDRTIQGDLRRAAEAVFGGSVELGGSGRTDAGVHALAQVVHLKAGKDLPCETLVAGMNERLDPAIHVLSACAAPDDFHARHHAESRTYLYQISRRRTALGMNYVWWVTDALDLPAMASAARLFEGRHDFASYCERPKEQRSTVVVVESVHVAEADELVLIRITASHFLRKMVRRLVGVLVQVGRGALDEEAVRDTLEGRSLVPGQFTAPASGLFLECVRFPGDGPLPPIRPATSFRPAGPSRR